MQLKKLRCPECGANFESDEKVSFCSHCGAKLFFDDGNKNINYNYKTEDVAKIKEIEANKEIELKQMKEKTRFIENKWILNFISFYVFFFMFLGAMCIYTNVERPFEKQFWIGVFLYFAFYIIMYRSLHNKSNLQEKELQNIVNEIYADISAKNYDIALVKTKSLRYTEKWSNDIKEKWDDIRESLIKIIEEKSR